MDRQLRLQVVFGAIDKLLSPMRGMMAGSKALSKTLAETQRELTGLRRAQSQIAQFKAAEARLKSSSAEMIVAKNTTAALRREIEQVEKPTARMTAALAKAEAAERKAADREAEHGHRLQELSGKLGAAGIDVADLARHEAQLADRVQQTNRTLDRQRDKLARIKAVKARGEAIQSAGGKIAGAGAIATVGITAPVIAEIRSAIPEAIASNKALADVNAALASMGPLAKRNIGELQAQASKLQDTSLFDDDDIMKNVTANMLTFGKVSGQQFDRAQQAVVDLTARLGGDLQGRAIMVGKALNDPVKGITALGRAGVQLTEAQKKSLKAMVKAGNVAGAQNIILGELEKQYRGAAQAQRDADPTAASQQAWRTFQENVGGAALKVLPAVTNALNSVLNAFNALTPEQQKFLVIAAMVLAGLGPVITVIGGIVAAVGAVISGVAGFAGAIGVAMLPAIGIILAIVAAVGVLAGAGYLIYRNWGAITKFFSAVWKSVAGFFAGVWDQVKQAFAGGLWGVLGLIIKWGIQLHILFYNAIAGAIRWVIGQFPAFMSWLGTAFTTAFRFLGTVLSTVFSGIVMPVLRGIWQFIVATVAPIVGLFRAVWNGVGAALAAGAGLVSRAWQGIKNVFSAGLGFLGTLGSQFATIGSQLLQGLVRGMLGALGWVKDQIVNVGSKVVGWFKAKLGIHSPSRVFAQLGGHIMSGLSLGLERNGSAPIAAMRGVSDRLTKAMAASALVMTPAAAIAMPARSASPFGSTGASAPFGGARPNVAPATAAPVAIGPFHFHGVAADDAEQLARAVQEAVERALEKHDRQAKADRRSSFEEQD